MSDDTPIKSTHAELLNRLDEMQRSPYYATARDTLAKAERVIVELEARVDRYGQEIADLRNVVQVTCIDGLPGLARSWAKYFPDHQIAISAAEDHGKCRPDGLMFDAFGNPRVMFARVIYEGSTCVCRLAEVADMVPRDDAGAYEVKDVWLSEQEFERLPEFEGW